VLTVPSRFKTFFARVVVREVQRVDEEIQIASVAEGNGFLQPCVDEIQVGKAPAAVEWFHVNGGVYSGIRVR